jgi:RND family efflux transporter MFP subunit
MNRILSIIAISSILVACGESQSSDKAAELEKLKKQQSELSTQIATLEAEIAKENPDADVKARYVNIDTLKLGTFVHYVEVQGTVESDKNVNVIARMPGLVTRVFVNEGVNVKKGQILAAIDDAVIRKNLEELNTRMELANTVFERQKKLWDQKIGTEIQYLQAKNNRDALANTIATLNEQLDMTLIKSPIDGVIDMVDLKEGEMANMMMPAFRVVNFNQLKAAGELAETYLSTVEAGDAVTVLFPDLGAEESAKVTFVSRAINPVSRTFRVEVALSSNKTYRPNMINVMKIVDYTAANAVSVPMNVIQNDQGGAYVYIAVREGKNLVVKKAMVTVGKIYRGKAEITSGLKAGDVLITLGYQDLNEGDYVKL